MSGVLWAAHPEPVEGRAGHATRYDRLNCAAT